MRFWTAIVLAMPLVLFLALAAWAIWGTPVDPSHLVLDQTSALYKGSNGWTSVPRAERTP